jgi:hypothetical protein
MIALPIGAPRASTVTVPDHWDVTDTAVIWVPGEVSTVRRAALTIALHQAVRVLLSATCAIEHEVDGLGRGANDLATVRHECHLRSRSPEVNGENVRR